MSATRFLVSIGIAVVWVLSSVPVVVVDASGLDLYCTDTHNDKESCTSDKQHNCVWCVSRAVPSKCYNAEDAKNLPPAVFVCGQKDDLISIETL
jgi:hypothetical protein